MTALHVYQCDHCGTKTEAGQFAPPSWLQDDAAGIRFDLCPSCTTELMQWLKAAPAPGGITYTGDDDPGVHI